MTVDERSRLQLAEALKRVLGDDEGITMMELLPPVGWADVATKHDLLALESRVDLRFDAVDLRFDSVDLRFENLEHRFDAKLERELRRMQLTMLTLLITGFLATILAVVLAAVLTR
jgi:hypothetical protein